MLYEDEAELHGTVVPALRAALLRGERVVCIATPEHHGSFLRGLGDVGAQAREDGELWLLDAAEVLTRILRDEAPDAECFARNVGTLVREAASGGRRVQAYGEMVNLLWSLGNVHGALALERLWEELRATLPFSLICAYQSECVTSWGTSSDLRALCATHTSVLAGLPAVGDAEVCARFPRRASSPSDARRLVGTTLASWGAMSSAEDAVFVVSELATNAVLHAQSGFTVSLERRGGVVRLSVGDASPRMAPAPERGALPVGGRGLHLVAALSSRWGQDVRPDGKLVWAEFAGGEP